LRPVFSERHVREIDDVDIEVHEQSIAAILDSLSRSKRGLFRAAGNLVDGDHRDVAAVDHGAFERRRLLVSPGEEDDLIGFEQRGADGHVHQFRRGSLLAQHVGQAHPVQGAFAHATWDVEVGVRVEVHESEPFSTCELTSDRADADRAVASEHQGGLSRTDSFGDASGGVADDLHHLVQVLGAPVVAVRVPAPLLAIFVVAHENASVAQRLDQARVAERPRCLLLTRSEGPGAGRDADQPQRSTHRRVL
jgi:hypothetical protein